MFAELQPCTSDTVRAYIRYIRATPVAKIGWLLERGDHSLSRGIITSLKILGSLKTEFGDLGGVKAREEFGQEKFLVRQVLGALRDPRCTDRKSRQSIEYFMALDEKGELESRLKVTLLFDRANYQIKAGDKRAVAFYESRMSRGGGDAVGFPVYVVSPR